MTVCIVGEILSVDKRDVVIRDRFTKEEIKAELIGDEVFEVQEGFEGLFVGSMFNNLITIKLVEIRKFLDPLYEKDLYDISGKFSFVPVLKDPFTDAFIKFQEEEARREEERLRIIAEQEDTDEDRQLEHDPENGSDDY